MSKPYEQANQLASQIFRQFMEQVVETHVLNERVRPLGEPDKKMVEQGKIINLNAVHLMSISGKGGYSDDPEKFARYRENHNVTLLDHILSVTRGALVLASLSWLQADPDMPEASVIERLKVLTVVAFLHDLDKMLQLPRGETLTLEHVEAAVARYGLHGFLGDISLSAEQVRFLIEQVETSQAFRHPCSIEPKRSYIRDAKRYAQLADKLDGLWYAQGSKAGLDAVIERLSNDQALSEDGLGQWRKVDLFDPHHPFLLDELQRSLSSACKRQSGIPPLLEVHQDGRLLMLLPEGQADSIIERGLARLLRALPFHLEVIFVQGKPKLCNDKPDYTKLIELIDKDLSDNEIGQIFKIKKTLIPAITSEMDSLLKQVSLQPQWPDKQESALVSPYSNPSILDAVGQQGLRKAARIALLLKFFTNKQTLQNCVQQLVQLFDIELPAWISEISDPDSQAVLLSLWSLAVTDENSEKNETLWGADGLLKIWLEGTDEQDGFANGMTNNSAEILEAVRDHFSQLLSSQRVRPRDEKQSGRCLFTDMPVSNKTVIRQELGLYEVKASAFTGRSGKPDSITAPSKGVVPIGLVSMAEHKLRQEAFNRQGGKPSGVPTLVSSPITTGLFGALILDNEQNLQVYSSYDLNRKKIIAGKASFKGLEVYRYRIRVARLERIPERLVSKKNSPGQIETLEMLLRACLRMGRPLHLFRGLPTPQKAFFYFDAMPRILQNLLGANELRLEQIPLAIRQLELAQTISSATGLGYDVLTLYALRQTRFKACARVWCYAQDLVGDPKQAKAMRYLQSQMIQSQQENDMSEQDGALVLLGQAAIKVQYPPKGSHSEEMLVFNCAMDTAIDQLGLKQTDTASLINGVAGELSINLSRKKKEAFGLRRSDLLDAACLEFAEQFVNQVWLDVLKGKPPAQKERRLLGNIYRMAFLQACRQAQKDRKAASMTAETTTTEEEKV